MKYFKGFISFTAPIGCLGACSTQQHNSAQPTDSLRIPSGGEILLYINSLSHILNQNSPCILRHRIIQHILAEMYVFQTNQGVIKNVDLLFATLVKANYSFCTP